MISMISKKHFCQSVHQHNIFLLSPYMESTIKYYYNNSSCKTFAWQTSLSCALEKAQDRIKHKKEAGGWFDMHYCDLVGRKVSWVVSFLGSYVPRESGFDITSIRMICLVARNGGKKCWNNILEMMPKSFTGDWNWRRQVNVARILSKMFIEREVLIEGCHEMNPFILHMFQLKTKSL